MRIGILGTGEVGRAMAMALAARRHEVRLGTRCPEGELADEARGLVGASIPVVTFAEAAEFGEAIVIATVWAGTHEAIRMAGPDRFMNKIVIDVTHPYRMESPLAVATALAAVDGAALSLGA